MCNAVARQRGCQQKLSSPISCRPCLGAMARLRCPLSPRNLRLTASSQQSKPQESPSPTARRCSCFQMAISQMDLSLGAYPTSACWPRSIPTSPPNSTMKPLMAPWSFGHIFVIPKPLPAPGRYPGPRASSTELVVSRKPTEPAPSHMTQTITTKWCGYAKQKWMPLRALSLNSLSTTRTGMPAF